MTGAPWPASLRGVRAAFAHLTRIPVGGFPYADDDWRWSGAHFPLVGALLGAVLGGVWLVGLRAGHLVAAVVVVACSLLLTGAMHEDGLADTADALGGGSTPERVLAILKDSRIGTYGAAALTVAILLRVGLLTRLDALAPVALVLAGSLSRLAPVWLMSSLPYVTDVTRAKSGPIVAAGLAQGVVASLWVAALSVALAFSRVMSVAELGTAWMAAAVVALLCASRFRARVGGVTGDFLGATQQISECAVLLVLAIARGGPP